MNALANLKILSLEEQIREVSSLIKQTEVIELCLSISILGLARVDRQLVTHQALMHCFLMTTCTLSGLRIRSS